jgi:chromosomal replication initiation ATPase DnaA
MNHAEIEAALKVRDCAIVHDGGKYALVYPHGYDLRKRAHDLGATSRNDALAEAWVWLHPISESGQGFATIRRVVAESFGFPPEMFESRDRSEPLATARRVAMSLSRELTGATFEAIGSAFARDANTAIYAQQTVADQCGLDPRFAARVGTLRAACLHALLNPTA